MKKDKKESTKNNNKEIVRKKEEKDKKEKAIAVLTKIDENRKLIYCFVGGLLLGLLILAITWPDRIATLKDGTQPVAKIDGYTITADDLYEDMKDYYSVSLLLDMVDSNILEELYPETDDMTTDVETTAQNYISMYESYYNYTEEEFLSANGFENYEAFVKYLTLDYRRNKYYEDYLKSLVTDEQVEEYYKNDVFGDINTQHILVEVSDDEDDGLTDDEAKALAQEIIDKLNDGATWEEVQEEYADSITYEDLGYVSFNSDLEESFMTALKDMDNNSYSDEPVETSYGYHVIYRLDQKDKPELDDVEDDIIQVLADQIGDEDENMYYKALMHMREDADLEFTDSVLKAKYEAYCEKYS